MPDFTSGKANGYVQIFLPNGGFDEAETIQCVHCQAHWMIQPGSGIKRGFCLRCVGPTCGKQNCETKCVPAERMIEEMETLEHGRRNLALAIERLREPDPFLYGQSQTKPR